VVLGAISNNRPHTGKILKTNKKKFTFGRQKLLLLKKRVSNKKKVNLTER
jgi:hypothetical protein